MASSQDSSSDSSTSSPHHLYNGPNIDVESLLPGVLMSQNPIYAEFFCNLMALGSQLESPALRNSAHALLRTIPCDIRTMEILKLLFTGPSEPNMSMDNTFFRASSAEVEFALKILCKVAGKPVLFQVLYHLEVLYAMLMPAMDTLSDKTFEFQYTFLTSGEAHLFLEMFTKNNFMCNADNFTRRSAYLVIMKICKLILTSLAHVLVTLSEDHTPPENEPYSETTLTPGMHLSQALRSVPGHSDYVGGLLIVLDHK